MARTPPPTGAQCWKWGLFYVDPADRRVLVPRRLGPGRTLNLGRPAAWLLLLLVIGLPLVLALLVVRAM